MGKSDNQETVLPPGVDAASVQATDHAASSSTHRSPNIAQATLLGSALGQLGLALVITIYLGRVLSPAAFGFFSLVGSIFILARKILDLGLSNVAARDITGDPQRERPILEGMMAYRRAAGVALALGLCIFAVLQRAELERSVLLAVAAVLLFTEPAALDPVFQVRQAQAGPALLNVSGGLLILGGSLLFRRFAVAGAAFAFLLVVREAFSLLFTKILAERLLGYHPKAGFRQRQLKKFVGPAVLFGLASLVYSIYFNCDVFFVYALRGKDELGAYAAAFRPINPLLLLPWLLMVPMIPVLTAAATKERETFVRQVRSICGLALGVGATGLVAGTLLAPDLVQLLYGDRYLVGPLSSVNAFRWLAVALGLVCATTVLTASMLADRKERILVGIGISALIANVALNFVLLQRYNFTAAGFATAATELLFLVSAAVAFQIVAGRSAISWSALPYLLPALVMGIVLQLLHGGAAFRVMGGVVLGLISVGTVLLSPEARRFRHEMASRSVIVDV